MFAQSGQAAEPQTVGRTTKVSIMQFVPAVICKPSRSIYPIRTLTSKIGGSPIGITSKDWPNCRHCGREMDFLIQLDLQTPISFSNKFKFAYIFFCNGYTDEPNGHQCPSWDPRSGANSVLLLSSPNPSSCVDGMGVVRYDDFLLLMKTRFEPVVDGEDYSLPDQAFLDKTGNEDIREYTSCLVKIGGTPMYLQTPEKINCPECGGRLTFLAQIGSELENPGWGGYSFNTGGGELFVFKCFKECSPKGVVMYLQVS